MTDTTQNALDALDAMRQRRFQNGETPAHKYDLLKCAIFGHDWGIDLHRSEKVCVRCGVSWFAVPNNRQLARTLDADREVYGYGDIDE